MRQKIQRRVILTRYLLLLLLLSSGITDVLAGDPLTTARQRLHNTGLDKSYAIETYLHPNLFQSDLNGDHSPDLIVPVRNKTTGKKGLIIFSGHGGQYYVIGAGRKFGDTGDDFKWALKWAIYDKPTASKTIFDKKTGDLVGGQTVKLQHPGILILNEDSNGCIIYWDGRKYTDIHQGE